MASNQYVATLTIANGDNNSNAIGIDDLRRCESLVIVAPGTLDGAVSVQVADGETSSANFRTLESPSGTDVTVTVDRALVLTAAPFPQLRLVSDNVGGETADRVFKVWGRIAG